MDSVWGTLLQNCEEDVRAGRLRRAAAKLARVNPADVPREMRRPLANIARRSGRLEFGLRLLTSLVRSPRPEATPAERAEYAVLVQRTGGVREALRLLADLDPGQQPETLLYRAYCHFSLWEYDQALPLLTTYVSRQADPYARQIGRLNEAAALLALRRWGEAEEIIQGLLLEFRAESLTRMQGNCHEMLAQIRIGIGSWEAARREIDRALQLLAGAQTMDQLFALKWKLYLDARAGNSLDPLHKLERLARERRHFETVREARLLGLTLYFNPEEFARLYFGTPFAGYRERIVHLLGHRPSGPSYLLNRGSIHRLHLDKEGQVHQLFRALTRDLYRPARLVSLFSELFPEEHFNIFSSPARVHQVLRRGRRWLEMKGLPVGITGEGGDFVLALREPIELELSAPPPEVTIDVRHAQALQFLRTRVGRGARLTTREIRTHLGVSDKECRRFVQWARARRELEIFGAGPATAYYLTEAS